MTKESYVLARYVYCRYMNGNGMILKYFIIIILVSFSMESVFATEQILITISNDMNKIIFDGKWTHLTEWKHSSQDTLYYDDGATIHLRTAHQDNFIYVFADAVSDTQLDKKIDKAMVCIDANNDKTEITNADDYCFVVTLDEKEATVLQGGSFSESDHFKKIAEPTNFIGVGAVSDENDRYSSIPHTSYEFRIPTDLVGRSNTYGFYFGVYDGYSDKIYSWPQDIILDSPLQLPNPNSWGELVSPDKSLPEFGLPLFALIPAFMLVLYFTKFRI